MILITGDKGVVGTILTDMLPFLKKKAWTGFDMENDICEDILDFSRLSRVMKERRVRMVIHLAGVTDVTASLKTPAVYSAINYLGTRRVVDAMRWAGVSRIIYASSNSIEVSDSPYSQSKKQAEQYLLAQEDLDVSIVRLDSVINSHGDEHMVIGSSLLDNLLRAKHGKLIKANIHGNFFRRYMLPEDVIELFTKAVEDVSGIYSCDNPIIMRNRDYADHFVQAFGATRVSYAKPRPFEKDLLGETEIKRLDDFRKALQLISEKKIKFYLS